MYNYKHRRSWVIFRGGPTIPSCQNSIPSCQIFCLFFSHSPAIFAYWQDSLAEKLSTVTWQDRIEELAPPPDRKKWWQERIEFWQDGMVGPPLKMTQLRLCFTVITNLRMGLRFKLYWTRVSSCCSPRPRSPRASARESGSSRPGAASRGCGGRSGGSPR